MLDAMFRTLLLAFLLLVPIAAEAQGPAPKPAPAGTTAPTEPAVLTLKERLGAKWKDEQRVNNCNVPPEKRGAKPRPDACAQDRSH